MENIKMNDWYWHHQKRDDIQEDERNLRITKRRRYLRFRSAARKVFLVELAVIGFEALYRFGGVIRGYDSFGGESLVLLALAAAFVWRISK